MFVHRKIEGEMRSLTISKTLSGKRFVSVLVESGEKPPETKGVRPDGAIGTDVGTAEFLTVPDGLQIGNIKNLGKSKKLLGKRHKQSSIKRKGSSNHSKARVKVAEVQEHIANQGINFQNKASDALARYHERSLFDCNLITPSSIHLFTDSPSTF